MKENQLKTYCAPECRLVHVETSSLMSTSFPSQHNPAQPGGTSGDAKQAPSWMIESEEETEHSSWED